MTVEQGSPEWMAMRLGKATASRIADALARTKTGWGASRANYMAELIAERLTGVPVAGYTNAAMQRGSDKEPDAKAAYEFLTNTEIVAVDFVDHPSIPMAGASPDGLVGDDGLIEVKCPNTATHLDTLLGGTLDGRYMTQMQWQMACTGRTWCDWVSFDPRLPPAMQLFIRRVHADHAVIGELETQIREFLAELDRKVSALNKLFAAKQDAA